MGPRAPFPGALFPGEALCAPASCLHPCRCRTLLVECFALFLALPAPPSRQHQQPQQPALTVGQLEPLDVARRLLDLLRSCSCGRVEVVANLIRIVQPLAGGLLLVKGMQLSVPARGPGCDVCLPRGLYLLRALQ